MKNYVVHLTPLRGMIASSRIASFIARALKMPTVTTPEECREATSKPGSVKNVIVVNGPPAFCKFRDELAELICDADNWIWVQNDYTIYPPSQINKEARRRKLVRRSESYRAHTVWTAIPGREFDFPDGTDVSVINWNALTMTTSATPPWGRGRRGVVYYGAFRQNRADRFSQFLPRDAYISAPGRGSAHFQNLRPDATIVPAVDDVVEMLKNFEATVLIHDKRSDRKFEYPPNRFYESLSAGIAMYMSYEMSVRLEQAGYPVDEKWIIANWQSIPEKGHSRVAASQADAWAARAVSERRNLAAKVRKLYEKL